jgi:hypothetical protein
MIDDATWSVAKEWSVWGEIERLASTPQAIEDLSGQYFEAAEHSLKPFYDEWPAVLNEYLGAAE